MRIQRTITTIAVLGATLGGGAAFAASHTASQTASPTPALPASAVSEVTTDGTSTADSGSARLGLRWVLRLSAEDRSCLDKAGIRRPVGPLNDAERAAVKAEVVAAATACGIDVPDGTRARKAKAFWDGLTDTQRDCLRDANVTRPLGPLSTTERRQLRSDLREAATTCGVTRPEKQGS